MNIDILGISDAVDINYNDAALPRAVREQRPMLFGTCETGYCCLLGMDPQTGSVGFGANITAAMAEWEQDYYERETLLKNVQQKLAQLFIQT